MKPKQKLKRTTDRQPGLWNRLVRFGFRLLYHDMAWSYDAVAWLVSFGQWKTWGQTALPYLKGKRVLELGHGPGHLLLTLSEQGVQVVGIDPSVQMGRLAQNRLHRAGRTPHLVRGRAPLLPFPDAAFRSIVATFPTPYIFEPSTLREVKRVLKPDGRLVIVVGAQLRGQDPLTRFVEWLYFITGQRETAADWQSIFETAHLTVRPVEVELKRSQVLLLLAEHVTQGDTDAQKSD